MEGFRERGRVRRVGEGQGERAVWSVYGDYPKLPEITKWRGHQRTDGDGECKLHETDTG